MKERPILFSAPMVRAILAGSKTQTRRAVKHGGGPVRGAFWDHAAYRPFVCGDGSIAWEMADGSPMSPRVPTPSPSCPYGQPGDRLWVRETWRVVSAAEGDIGYRSTESYQRFLSDGDREWWKRWERKSWGEPKNTRETGARWVPAIYMPRWASRITLEVTAVRVERLHDITEEDARAEGAHHVDGPVGPYGIGHRWSMERPHPIKVDSDRGYQRCLGTARMAFADLWASINGAESWEANPWVWVVSFKRLEEVSRG